MKKVILAFMVMGCGGVESVEQIESAAKPPAPNFSLNASSLTMAAGESMPSVVTVSRTNFTGLVTLSVSGLPASYFATSFTINPVGTSPSSSTLSISSVTSTPVGAYNFTVTGVGGNMTRTVSRSVTITAPVPPPTGEVEGRCEILNGSLTGYCVSNTGCLKVLVEVDCEGHSPSTETAFCGTYVSSFACSFFN